MRHTPVIFTCIALTATAAEPTMQVAVAEFFDAKGASIGRATLVEGAAGVLIQGRLMKLPPGEHAFHVHAIGKCEPATGFKSAGDHYAATRAQHGFLHAQGPHAGDMPNQFVPADGVLHLSVLASEVTLAPGPATLFDQDGSSLVLHAKADDYRSQPSGNAGERIACAVVTRATR